MTITKKMNQKILLSVLFSAILLSVIPIQDAYACDFAIHPEKCTRELVEKILKDTVDPIVHEIKKIEGDLEKDIRSLEGELINEVKIIKKDVVHIVDDAESIEKTLVNDIKTDVKDIKEDIAKIDKVIVSVENIEKKVVNESENIVETIIKDIKTEMYVILAILIAIPIAYLVIKIIEFAIWLKAYLRQDGIEHNAKKQVLQNDEIIKLLKELLNK